MENVTKMKKIYKWNLFFALSLVLTFVHVTCTDEPPTSEPVENPANFNDFLTTLPNWETFSPLLPEMDDAVGPPVDEGIDTIEGEQYNVTSTPYSLSATPERMTTMNPDVEILWVGSLLQGDGYVGGIGSLAELPIRQRNPLVISINLLFSDNSRVVQSPTVATVNQAIGELISGADASGHKAGSDIFYQAEQTHSIVQAMLKVGVSASYSGATIKAALETNMSDETRTVTAYFVQNMFTVSMVLPQNPQDVFSNQFTQEMLNQEIASGRMSPDNPPVFVSSIVYGRILMFSFTSTSTEAKINATLNALYADYGGELSSELQAVLDNAQIQVVTVGGDAEHALSLIRSNNLAEFFSSDAPITTARPISYTVRNLKDNTIAQVSETTEYNLRQYTPVMLEATGAEYEITMLRIKAVNLFPWLRVASLTYDLSVRDVVHGDQLATTNSVIQLFTEGVEKGFKNVEVRTVAIHFDGRDYVELPVGQLRDWYWTPFVNYNFASGENRTYPHRYRWPNAKMPQDDSPHEHSITRTVDLLGNQWKMTWRVRRTKLLYD